MFFSCTTSYVLLKKINILQFGEYLRHFTANTTTTYNDCIDFYTKNYNLQQRISNVDSVDGDQGKNNEDQETFHNKLKIQEYDHP